MREFCMSGSAWGAVRLSTPGRPYRNLLLTPFPSMTSQVLRSLAGSGAKVVRVVVQQRDLAQSVSGDRVVTCPCLQRSCSRSSPSRRGPQLLACVRRGVSGGVSQSHPRRAEAHHR
jgi:hypothetical protein